METKQVPIDGGLHFNVDVEDSGHVRYSLDLKEGPLDIAQYCPDTKELTLFEVTSRRQATEVVQTQLNHTTAGILNDPLLAVLMDLFGTNPKGDTRTADQKAGPLADFEPA